MNYRLPPLGERWRVNCSRCKYKHIKYNLHVIIGMQANMHTIVITLSVINGGHTQWELIELQYAAASITGDVLDKSVT